MNRVDVAQLVASSLEDSAFMAEAEIELSNVQDTFPDDEDGHAGFQLEIEDKIFVILVTQVN